MSVVCTTNNTSVENVSIKEKAALHGGFPLSFFHASRLRRIPRKQQARQSDILLHFSGLEAPSAHFHATYSPILKGTKLDEIGVPGSARAIFRVRHVISEKGPFTADFTNSRHSWLHRI